MSQYTFTGTLTKVFDTQTFASGFSKREFVVTTADKYPQDVKFELHKEKTALIDRFAIGAEITVHFNIRGNEYKERYFVNLQAWKIEAVKQEEQAQTEAQQDFTMPDATDVDEGIEPPF